MYTEVYPSTFLFPPRECYKTRALNRYQYTPRSKIPPNWQRAQSFVKALVVARIGQRPYFSRMRMAETKRYQREYVRLRTEYQVEDFPINP